MRGSRASRSRLAPTNRSRWEVRGATDGIVSRHAIAPGKRGAAGTGNKVAPVSALLRPARPCSYDGRLARTRARPPVARPGAAMKSSPCAMTCSSRPCVLRFKRAGITTTQFDVERVVGHFALARGTGRVSGRLFSERGCIRGGARLGGCRRTSPHRLPMLCSAPSRAGRWRGYLGLTPPQPRGFGCQRNARPANIRSGHCAE